MGRTERVYYLIYSLYGASWSFMTAVYTLFLLHRGLDLFQVNVVFAVYLITAFLFEVPTGAVADVFGRKVSFIFSCVLRSIAFMLYWFADSFGDFLFAEFIDAIGTTLATGALDAWAVDRLHAEGDAGGVERLFRRAFIICRPFMISAGVLGAYCADINIDTPWLLGSACFAATGLLGMLLMRETWEPPLRHHGLVHAWAATTRSSFVTVSGNPQLALLCAVTAATSFAVMPAWHYWPARLSTLAGSGIWLMGWVGALIHIASMCASLAMPYLVHRFAREHILVVAWLLRGSMLLMASLSTSFGPALAGILIMEAVFGLSEPTLLAWMNDRVDSEQRATVLSVRSMSFTLGGGLGLITLGLVAQQSGIPLAWGISAVLLLVVAPVFLFLRHTHTAVDTYLAKHEV